MNNPRKRPPDRFLSRADRRPRRFGQTAAEVAEAFGVSVRTVRKRVARHKAGGRAALVNGASATAR
ncbi:MAG: hypothetical protein Kow0013_21790 [Pararhodobacter sp.]